MRTELRRAWAARALATLPALLACWSVLALVPGAAGAAAGDVGFSGPSTAGAGAAPTGEKPESKLWFNDGRWWASMYHAASGTYHIFWLNRSASPQAWVDTGTQLDPRPKSRADTLWDGTHLYVASAPFASSNTTGVTGNPARLYRYGYDPVTRSYKLDAGFPVDINATSSETITLDRDTTGRLWATWTQGQKVLYSATTTPGEDRVWSAPAVLPVAGATGLTPDDISSVVAFGKSASAGGTGGRIGIMWSNQTDSTTYFALHNDGDPPSSWQPSEPVSVPGRGQSDDHLSIKDLQSDPSGRVFAVIKTSLNDVAGSGSSAPQIVVVSRAAKGGWSRATYGTVADCHTRPVMVLDSTNNLVHVYATAPESGCAYSGAPGSIFEKTSPMSSLSFPSGRGTVVMRDAASPNLNNITATKQTVTAASGVVLLASNDSTQRYWTSDQALPGAPAKPTSSFTATPSSGTAPVTVQFKDTSSGSPTSWAWDFGDGTGSTEQHPQHTYTSPGTYTSTLVASNVSGAGPAASSTVTVTANPPVAGVAAVGSSTAVATSAVPAVRLVIPAEASAGDVVVASFTADNNPTVAAPAGWTPVVTGLKPNAGAAVFAYYHVVAAGEAGSSVAWSLSAAQKWGGGMTAFRGVDTAQPLDVPTASTAVNSSGTATSVAVPGVTTVTPGAMLVGGLGADGSSSSTNPPAGWTESFDSLGGQMAEQAFAPKPAAGATGPVTWTVSSGRALAVWLTALRPR